MSDRKLPPGGELTVPDGTEQKEKFADVVFNGLHASVRKRADGLFVAYWRENGKGKSTTARTQTRLRELAKTALKNLAKGQAGRVVTIEDAELVARLKQVAGDRSPWAWLSEVEAAQRKLHGQATLDQAVQHYAQSGMLSLHRILLEDARKQYLGQYAPEGIDSVSSMRKAITGFELVHPGVMIHEIQTKDLEVWLKRNDAGEKTYNNRRGFWITFMNWCRAELKALPRHEKHAAELLPRMKESDRVPPIFTPEVAAAALKVLPDYLKPSFIVGCWMGPRPESELRMIDWEMFDWERGYLHIVIGVARKTRYERFVPIPPNVRVLLQPFIKASGKISGRDHVTRMSQLLRFAKVIDVWPADVMRHSSISYAIASGKPIGRVAEEHGNSEGIIRRRYRRPLRKEDADKWYAVGINEKNN